MVDKENKTRVRLRLSLRCPPPPPPPLHVKRQSSGGTPRGSSSSPSSSSRSWQSPSALLPLLPGTRSRPHPDQSPSCTRRPLRRPRRRLQRRRSLRVGWWRVCGDESRPFPPVASNPVYLSLHNLSTTRTIHLVLVKIVVVLIEVLAGAAADELVPPPLGLATAAAAAAESHCPRDKVANA